MFDWIDRNIVEPLDAASLATLLVAFATVALAIFTWRLARQTAASVATAQRSATTAEQAYLAGIRAMLADAPPEVITAQGVRVTRPKVEPQKGAIAIEVPLRNIGSGLALLAAPEIRAPALELAREKTFTAATSAVPPGEVVVMLFRFTFADDAARQECVTRLHEGRELTLSATCRDMNGDQVVRTEAKIQYAPRAASDERRAFVGLLAFAGLRLSEALGLTWADVDFEERVLHVRFQLERETLARVVPKTARAVRTIEVDDGLLSILRTWKARSGWSQPQYLVVTTRTGTPLNHHSAGRRLTTVVKKAGLEVEGLPKITPHQLRYSFGSLLVDAGESTARVSRLMGHEDEATTGRIYVHEIERRDNRERTRATMREAFGSGPRLLAVEA